MNMRFPTKQKKFRNLKMRPSLLIFGIGLFVTLIAILYTAHVSSGRYMLERKILAQNINNAVLSNYTFYKSAFMAIESYYVTDTEVSYKEFSRFFKEILGGGFLRYNIPENVSEIGWFSSESGDKKTIVLNTKSYNPVFLDQLKNPFFNAKRLAIIHNEIAQKPLTIEFYDGQKFFASKVPGKSPANATDPEGFYEDGYFYILVNVDRLLGLTLRDFDTSGLSVSLDYAGNTPENAQAPEGTPILNATLDVIDPRLSLKINDVNMSAMMPRFDANSLITLLIGIAISALLSLHVENLNRKNMQLSNAIKQANETNRLKSEFLATMSHEIRTPMNGILGMAELIIGTKPNAQVEAYVKTLISSSESMLQIIDDILDFSKIEAGKLDLDPVAVDMLQLVDDVAELYSVKAREKALELAVRYVPGSERFVFADSGRLRQVLGNLIGNALKFTDKGHILITVEDTYDVTFPAERVCLKFTIEDTGIGIAPEAHRTIFEKFLQADTSTTRKYGGTGLGLSICKNLVEMMGGTIHVESTPGKGSKFIFLIPFKRNLAEAYEQPAPPILRGTRALIVDDLPIIRQIVSEQLILAGMICDTAGDAERALDMMQNAYEKEKPYDIIIIDYLMPQVNGEMLANTITNHTHLREACLIMLTAAGSPLADDNFRKAGFSAYIGKPVRHKALIETLAIVWREYKGGNKHSTIRLDTHALGKEEEQYNEYKMTNRNILVAEDNLVNQIFIRKILEDMDTNATIVANGQEAIDAVKAKNYDLILMDCLMPVMDGFEATREICKLKADGIIKDNLPIVALTANAMKGDREKCIAAGMDDYLAKPVRKKELMQTIHRIIMDDKAIKTIPTPHPLQDNAANQAAEPAIEDFIQDIHATLDLEAVQSARNILKDKYEEVIIIYIDSSLERIEEIIAAINEHNIEAVIRPAHTLKSMSKQMGANKLSELAKEIELSAKTTHNEGMDSEQALHDIAQSLERVKFLWKETCDALKRNAA